MQKSWKAFIKNGDPSYPGHEWKPYNGIQLHMEIENDATVSIGDTTLDPVVKNLGPGLGHFSKFLFQTLVARNDEFFDFDVFQDLDLLQPVDESCVSTRLTTTTNAPPTDYCNTIRISGSENHYGAVGTYHKSGTLNGKNKVSFDIVLHTILHWVQHLVPRTVLHQIYTNL